MKTKNITVFAISVVCALMFTGCSSSEGETIVEAATQPTQSPSSTPSPVPEVDGKAMPNLKEPEPVYSSTKLFCDITDANGLVTSDDVTLATNIAEEMRNSGNELLVPSAQNYEIFANEFQFALDEKKGQLAPYEMEIITKSCGSSY
jgi:hypothetical protein